MMVAAISATPNPKSSTQGGHHQNRPQQNRTRPPLLPSEGDNVVPPRRPKSREVTSRYMSSTTTTTTSSSNSTSTSTSNSSSRRFPSPLVSRNTGSTVAMTPAVSAIKRSQSVERRRPATPRPYTPGNAGDVLNSTASKMLLSTRSLSVSFQGKSFSLQVSKAKPEPVQTPSVRRGTPERRKATPQSRGGRGDGVGVSDQGENSKPTEQHRWPGRLRQGDTLCRSLDCTDERKRSSGSGSVVRALQRSIIDERCRPSIDSRLRSELGSVEQEKTVESVVDSNSVFGSAMPSDCIASDADSVSSESTSGAQESGSVVQGRGGPRGIVVPARFWQETHNRLRQGRMSESGSPVSKAMGLKTTAPPKLIVSRKLLNDSPASSPRSNSTGRGLSSPLRGATRPASPSKLGTSATSSPSRGMPSPSRARGVASTLSSNLSNMPSILTFAADVRRGKMGENRIEDAHSLRLLYNRLLQWRFVNARADAALLVQTMTAEKSLYKAWIATSELRESVRDKRTMLQLLRQNMKLTSILKGQMLLLEECSLMERDHSSSLLGAIEALKASTLRLPVGGGATADVQNVKDAICSAVDVMQAMASSICSLLSKVEEVNSWVAELANIAGEERAMLDHCRYILSIIASMQVKDCSLRTHLLQLQRVLPSSLTSQV